MVRRFAVSALAAATLAALAAPASAGPYRLPWQPGTSMQLTQDCNDSCCNDHVGNDEYAWDFANGTEFPIVAAREGTVAHVKTSSTTGCGASSCANDANYLVIDHGDGTQSVYLHLKGGSLDPAVRCGEFVRQGQHLATADSTGWSTGTHLHYQTNALRGDMATTCECGADGMGCAGNTVAWGNFWPNATYPTKAIDFDEWNASACGDRRLQLPGSTNADAMEAIGTVDDADGAHFSWVMGMGTPQSAPSYHGSFSSAPTQPDGKPTVIGRFALDAAVASPGVYAVWGFVPLSSHATASHAKHVAIARGARATGTVDQNAIGGGFHPVTGLEKLKLTGHAGEAVLVQNDTGDSGAEIAFDAVLVHWIGPPGPKKVGDPCADATECEGALVCDAGHCKDGCDTTGCACGATCDPTGLCTGGGQGGCGGAGGASASSSGAGTSTGSSSSSGSSAGAGGAGHGATSSSGGVIAAGGAGGNGDDGGVKGSCGCRAVGAGDERAPASSWVVLLGGLCVLARRLLGSRRREVG